MILGLVQNEVGIPKGISIMAVGLHMALYAVPGLNPQWLQINSTRVHPHVTKT